MKIAAIAPPLSQSRADLPPRRTWLRPAGLRRAVSRLWPRSMAARTALTLAAALILVQACGLAIYAYDRIGLQRLAQLRDIGVRSMTVYRAVAMVAPDERPAVLREIAGMPGISGTLLREAPRDSLLPLPPGLQRQIRLNMALVPVPLELRPAEVLMRHDPRKNRLFIAARLPDGPWLDLRIHFPPARPWQSGTFLFAFLVMSLGAVLLVVWAVRKLIAPVTVFAEAAERLGRDVNAPPMLESGPAEVATAAAAFNRMAARIRRFVEDRTLLLTAIGHDLRTPITRLKLRAEFVEDDEQRRKMLSDLDELEAMVSATLTFGREAASTEPVSALDLPVLLQTILDEFSDLQPEGAARLAYDGPEHLTVRARPIGLKRAFTNLIGNALAYGGGARVMLHPPRDAMLTIDIDDEGPGIPPEELERLFEPFRRLEASRSRETGGIGLGLPIARNILRAHGGDVRLMNRPGGGARALVTLPA